MARELFIHEVNLGEALSDAEIDARIAMEADSEMLVGLLQFLRNEAAQYDVEAHDKRAMGKGEAATLAQGAAQGLRSFFSEVIRARARGDLVEGEEGADGDN